MKVKPHLRHLIRKSYVKKEPALGQLLDCSLGRNPFGISERVLEVAQKYDWSRVSYYPEPTYKDLRQKLSQFWAEHMSLTMEQIKVANGAVVVLERLNKIFIEPGSKVLGYSPQFTEYITDVEACGGEYEAVLLKPEQSFKFDVARLVARITEKYRLIYIDNPNNPTGQIIPMEQIEEILGQAERKGVAVVVDEAFGDYMERENSAVNLMDRYRNLIVVRSFSKGFGLAGLRVGYGIFPSELAQYYDKIDIPFPVSIVGCYLAGEALSDQDFIHSCQRMVEREKQRLIQGLIEKDYLISETYKSCPIFVLGHKDRGIDLRENLLGKGILTEGGEDFRNLGGNYVRVNTPLSAEEFLARL